MHKYLENNLNSYKKPTNNGTIESLGLQWAKKYLQNLDVDFPDDESSDTQDFDRVMSQAGREITVQKLRASMRAVSLQAWNKTEHLLSKEIKRHRIKPEAIDPWEIAGDSFNIYEKALEVYTLVPTHKPSTVIKLAAKKESLSSNAPVKYTEQLAPAQLTKAISSSLGALRRKYTQQDPKVIGFLSMQFHFTSQMLLQLLSHTEQKLISNYFKVIDDYLYMPLQCAYSLCVMLYPTLKVNLEIIRQMLHLLGQEISKRLNTEQANTLMPYFQVMKAYVFS